MPRLHPPSTRLASVIGALFLASAVVYAQPSDTAEYEVRFDATWSAATHPDGFPPNPHFSSLIGATHNDQATFWQTGGNATAGIEQMAETGGVSTLTAEINAAGANVRDVLNGAGIGSPGSTTITFEAHIDHPLVTLVSMLAPSPDWFVGVSGQSLMTGGDWANELTIELFVFDAGTDSGTTYGAGNDDTQPQEPIALVAFAGLDNGQPVGSFTFTRLDAPVLPPPPTLFLQEGRFEVTATWNDFSGAGGLGQPVPITDDTGYFWFFNIDNVEVVIKVLRGCANNDHYWVFAGGLTSIRVDLEVVDTVSGQRRTYTNALGDAFEPILDAAAFPTCP